MAGLIKLVLVDDHPVVRDGLRALLEDIEGFEVIGAAADPEAAVALISRAVPDVAVCDLFFGRQPAGFELLATLAAQPGAPPVVIFSQFASDSLYRTALDAGAAGYLSKDAPLAEIADSLRAAAAGRSGWSTAALRAGHAAKAAPDERERVMLAAMAHGQTTAEIGLALGLATKTIEGRIAAMFRRYGVVSRTELTAKALSEGWIMAGPDD
jgi:DNA-binding NarL/FixJ family response regulator